MRGKGGEARRRKSPPLTVLPQNNKPTLNVRELKRARGAPPPVGGRTHLGGRDAIGVLERGEGGAASAQTAGGDHAKESVEHGAGGTPGGRPSKHLPAISARRTPSARRSSRWAHRQ